jgi:hypothetical protein
MEVHQHTESKVTLHDDLTDRTSPGLRIQDSPLTTASQLV